MVKPTFTHGFLQSVPTTKSSTDVDTTELLELAVVVSSRKHIAVEIKALEKDGCLSGGKLKKESASTPVAKLLGK